MTPSERLVAAAKSGGRDPQPVLALDDIFGSALSQSPVFADAVKTALEHLYDSGSRAALQRYAGN